MENGPCKDLPVKTYIDSPIIEPTTQISKLSKLFLRQEMVQRCGG